MTNHESEKLDLLRRRLDVAMARFEQLAKDVYRETKVLTNEVRDIQADIEHMSR